MSVQSEAYRKEWRALGKPKQRYSIRKRDGQWQLVITAGSASLGPKAHSTFEEALHRTGQFLELDRDASS